MGISRVSTCTFTISKLIVGLGNPTSMFENTRHSIGKTFIDILTRKHNVGYQKIKGGEIAYIRPAGAQDHIALFKPGSFMNVSGGPVKSAMSFYSISSLIVIADDLDQAVGKARIKEGGSAQGHNGIRSIIDVYGGKKDFKRVLIGVGRPDSKNSIDVAHYVNCKMPSEERKIYEDVTLAKVIELLKKSEGLQL